MHKRLILVAIAIPLLASCNRGTTVSYQLDIKTTDPAKRAELIKAAERIVENKLSVFGIEADATVSADDAAPVMTVQVPDKAVAQDLTDNLTRPFALEFMRRTGSGETADVETSAQGKFNRTGVNQDDIEWVRATTQPITGKGKVQILFTEDGLAEMKKLFQDYPGQDIGMFLRDVLASIVTMQPTQIADSIIIEGIPTPDIAQTFADDVNVGRFVTFSSSQ